MREERREGRVREKGGGRGDREVETWRQERVKER